MERLETNIVPPEGPLDAPACFIGEAPGEEEDRYLRPFIGDAGIRFNQMLKTVGILRREILITNIFRQRPPNNKINYFYQDSKNQVPTWEGQEHVDHLKRWLENLLTRRINGPNVLVAMGAPALHTLTGKKRISKWRGSVLPCTLVPGFKVYAMYHPSYVNRLMNEPEERLHGEKKAQQQNVLPLTLKDLERAMEQSRFPEIRRPERQFKIDLSLAEIVQQLRLLHKEPLTAVDIETQYSPNGPLLWCIGFAPKPDFAFTAPFLRNTSPCWMAEEEVILLKEISEVFLNEKILKIFHNGLYDLSVLGRYYGLRVATGSLADTMYCYHASYPYLRKALEVLTSIYTWEPYYKDDGKVWDGRRIGDEAEFVYNTRDCCITREIWPHVERDARELGTWSGYCRSISVVPSLLRMMIRGVKTDVEKKDRLGIEFSQRASSAQKVVAEEAGQAINLASPQQVNRLLYGYMGLPIQYHRKTGQATTDKDAINRLRKKYPGDKVLKAISEHSQFSKLSNTYTKMEVAEDGRVRTSYGWVSTYRLSSSESFFGGGGNLQSIPVRTEEGRLIRELFIADKGYILLASDLAQAEARVVAWLAGDLRLIEAFGSGYDVHWDNAKIIFRIPESVPYNPKAKFKDRVTGGKHALKWFRERAKTIVHAANYLMGPRMLQTILIREEVFLKESTCKGLLEGYRSANPFIVQWQNSVRQTIRSTRTIITPLGRKRVFRGRLNENLIRSAIAFSPQSTVGELVQLAIQAIHSDLDYYEPLLNVHDEVVGQCKPEDIEKAKKDIRVRMEIPFEINRKPITIPCDFKVGKSWGRMEEVE